MLGHSNLYCEYLQGLLVVIRNEILMKISISTGQVVYTVAVVLCDRL